MVLISSVARGMLGFAVTALTLLACGAEVAEEGYSDSDSEGAPIGQLKSALTGNPLRTAMLSTGFVLRYGPETAETTAMLAELRARLYQLPASAQSNIGESSYGLAELEVDPDLIRSVQVTNPGNCGGENWTNAVAQARTALADDDVSLQGYDRVHWVFPFDPNCGFRGRTDSRATTPASYDLLYNGSPQIRTISHELGHSLGAQHAFSYT